MSFRVRVDLSQVFSDERAKVFVFIPDRRKCVSWLVSRLGQLVGAPKDIALMVDDHLLPNEETLEVLQIGDRVSAISGIKKHTRKVPQEQEAVEDEESNEPIPSSWEPQEKRQHLIEACLMDNKESLQKVKQQALHLLKQFQTVPQSPIQAVPNSDVTDFCSGGSNYEHNQNVAASSAASENLTEDKARRRRRRVRRRKVPATDFTVTEIPAQMETELEVEPDHVEFSGETTATASEMEVSVSKQSNLLQLQQEKDIDSEQDEEIQEEVNEEERSNSGNDQSPLQPSMPYGRLIASV